MKILKDIPVKPSPRDFNLMILGQIVSVLGAALLKLALSLYVLDITGRADTFATLFAISNIPLLLTPLGGAIADRFNRRNLMVIYDFTSSLIILCLFILMSTGSPAVITIGIIMVLLSAISAMYTPAVSASIPQLVAEDRIESANGIATAVQALSQVAAPILGGILYKLIGADTLVIISCTAFFLAAVMEIFIRIPFTKRRQERGMIRTITQDMKDGFNYVIRTSFIRKAAILAVFLNLVLSPLVIVGAPIIFRVTLRSSESMYGIGMGIISLATIVGALTTGLLTKHLKMSNVYRWLLFTALLLVPVTLAVIPTVQAQGSLLSFTLFLGGLFPISMIMTLLSIFLISKVQKKTPNENLGKVMAIIMGIAQCAAPVGQLVYGRLFEVFQTSIYVPLLLIIGALMLIALAGYYSMRYEADDFKAIA